MAASSVGKEERERQRGSLEEKEKRKELEQDFFVFSQPTDDGCQENEPEGKINRTVYSTFFLTKEKETRKLNCTTTHPFPLLVISHTQIFSSVCLLCYSWK